MPAFVPCAHYHTWRAYNTSQQKSYVLCFCDEFHLNKDRVGTTCINTCTSSILLSSCFCLRACDLDCYPPCETTPPCTCMRLHVHQDVDSRACPSCKDSCSSKPATGISMEYLKLISGEWQNVLNRPVDTTRRGTLLCI